MWIMDLFQAGKQTGNAQNTQNAQAPGKEPSAALLQKEIRALAPGQVLSGQILEKTGEDLRLLVNFQGSELELQARLEQNIALSMGRNILFQVKNNGSGLSLSPLFENMGMEANAQKAVEMASLPVNDTTMQLVGQLMKEGMPIDKEALQTFYHEMIAFADAEVMDIIDLHKLGLPVNEENLEQMHSYKNMTHQLMGGIQDLSAQLPGLLQEMAGQGLEKEIGRLLAALLFCAAHAVFGMFIGLAFPKLDAVNETVVVKQSLAVVLGMFVPMAALGLCALLYWLGSMASPVLAMALPLALLAAFTAACGLVLMKKGPGMLRAL